MIWNTQTIPFGTRKTVKRFAWIPVALDTPKHHKVWLEHYWVDLEYGNFGYSGPGWFHRGRGRFVDKSLKK